MASPSPSHTPQASPMRTELQNDNMSSGSSRNGNDGHSRSRSPSMSPPGRASQTAGADRENYEVIITEFFEERRQDVSPRASPTPTEEFFNNHGQQASNSPHTGTTNSPRAGPDNAPATQSANASPSTHPHHSPPTYDSLYGPSDSYGTFGPDNEALAYMSNVLETMQSGEYYRQQQEQQQHQHQQQSRSDSMLTSPSPSTSSPSYITIPHHGNNEDDAASFTEPPPRVRFSDVVGMTDIVLAVFYVIIIVCTILLLWAILSGELTFWS